MVGSGAVAREYYLPAFRALGLSDAVLVTDLSEESLRIIRQRYHRMATRRMDFREALDLLPRQDAIDAVVIALPNWLHEDAAQRALKAGLHVLCEKPLALTRAACLHLAAEADAAHRILAVNMVRRWLPSFQGLAEGLRRGLIGPLKAVDIEDGGAYAWTSDSGAFFDPRSGGLLADIGVHHLDFIEELAGPLLPQDYQDDWAGGVEANVRFTLKTSDGVSVRMILSRTRTLRNTLRLIGTEGELIAKKDMFDGCWWHPSSGNGGWKISPTQPFVGTSWPPTLESCFAHQLSHFIQAVRSNTPPLVDARRAAATTAHIEWAYAHRPAVRTAEHLALNAAPTPLVVEPAPVLVTGGTGFVGTHLVRKLHDLGCERIAVPVRNYRTCAPVARFKVDLPKVDLLDKDQVLKAMNGIRWVFHLAYGRDGPNAARVTIEGTRHVVEAAVAAGCEAVVILSTMVVFGYPPNAVVDESWPYRPVMGEYGRSKVLMERWCLCRASRRTKTRVVILNPSCVYGPGGKTYTLMPLEMAQAGTFCWIEQGRGTANVTFIDNLVDAMLCAARCPNAHGQRFIINDTTTTWESFLTTLLGLQTDDLPSYTRRQLLKLNQQHGSTSLREAARYVINEPGVRAILGRTRMVQTIKPFLTPWLQQFQCETPQRGDSQPVPPPWLADLFGPTTTVFSSQKAQRILGWTPRVPLAEGLARTVAWLQDSGYRTGRPRWGCAHENS